MKNEKLNELSEKGKKAFDQVKKLAEEKIEKIKDSKKGSVSKTR
jgi:hypothetical protein